MSGNEQYFGIVRNGEFFVFAPQHLEGANVKLTTNWLEEPQATENGVIDLTEFEGKIIEVSGRDNGKWIYSAKVVEEAGPVLSNFLKKVFLNEEPRQKRCALLIGQKKDSPSMTNKNKEPGEFEFNDQLFHQVEKKIKHTAIFRILRGSETELPDVINELDPDFIINLHCYAGEEKTPGTEVLYYHESRAGKGIAEILIKHLAKYLPLPNRGAKAKTSNDECGLLLRFSTAPCVIVNSLITPDDTKEKPTMEYPGGFAEAFAKAIDEVSETVRLEHSSFGNDIYI